jgi:ArsR family transcriptional regulator
MDSTTAVSALNALANEHRLESFRRLVQAGPGGLTPGTLATAIGISPASMSFHIKDLLRTGLIRPRHEGRKIFYSARFETMNNLIGYLTENCCGGNPCSSVAVPACADERSLT